MSEEDQTVDVTVLPKFDMPSYESEMTSKDVKSLALRHGIPLDLHLVALTKGWTMDQLSDDMIGLYEQYFEFSGIRVPFSTFLLAVIKHFRVHISQLVLLGKQEHWFSFKRRVGKGAKGQVFRETFSGLKGWKKIFFFLDRRAIPDAMVWRHHDSDVNDPIPEDGFQASDVLLLTEQQMAGPIEGGGPEGSDDREETPPPLTKEQIEGHVSALKSLIKSHNRKNIGDPIRLDFEMGTELQGHNVVKGKEVMDEDLRKPFKEARRTPFTRRIIEFAGPEYKMPNNIKLYDGTTDPEDHLSRFAGAANSGE
ncbi:hypothetical protein Tco_0392465 [Tanacetum coccineum]